jgi:hypothetical protein
LLEASHQFVEHYQFRRDFLLVSALNDSTPPDFHKAPRALAILGLMVLASAFGLLQIMEAAFLAAGAMIVSGCITASRARRSVDLPVLVVIAASFALGNAMTVTGAAAWVAGGLLGFGELSPWVALALIYFLTAAFTEMITNNAAAVLMFPIALAVSQQLGVNFLPYAVAVMFCRGGFFYYATRLSNQSYGVRPWKVSFWGLCSDWPSAQSAGRGGGSVFSAFILGVLILIPRSKTIVLSWIMQISQ